MGSIEIIALLWGLGFAIANDEYCRDGYYGNYYRVCSYDSIIGLWGYFIGHGVVAGTSNIVFASITLGFIRLLAGRGSARMTEKSALLQRTGGNVEDAAPRSAPLLFMTLAGGDKTSDNDAPV
jgi:hypothetical protein